MPDPNLQLCPTHPPRIGLLAVSRSPTPFLARIGVGTRLKSVKVEPPPIKDFRPTTTICKQVFCATMLLSIKVVMKSEARNGKKEPSPTTDNINWQSWDMFTLSPMMQFSITAPAPMVTLSPIVVGPWITARGSIVQLRPIFTSSELSKPGVPS